MKAKDEAKDEGGTSAAAQNATAKVEPAERRPENPPAFPASRNRVNAAEPHGDHTGMTLRDYFAAKALSGLVISESNYPDRKLTAGLAYQYADAMLAERSAVPPVKQQEN